jgi:fructose-1-phosphate kinase PfkB-like protein
MIDGETFNASLLLKVPAGKGVNTARSLRCLCPKMKLEAAVWLGQNEATEFAYDLKNISRIKLQTCLRLCPTRLAQTLLENSGRETHIKETMPAPSAQEERKLLTFWKKISAQKELIAICGSAPEKTTAAILKNIFKIAAKAPYAIADTNGPALTMAAQSGLYGLKGNAQEIGTLLGLNRTLKKEDIFEWEKLWNTCGFKSELAPKKIMITFGTIGAALISGNGTLIYFAHAPRLSAGEFRSATGCGDASTAGWMWGILEQRDDAECLRRAVACGSAKAASIDPGALDVTLMRRLLKKIRVEKFKK